MSSSEGQPWLDVLRTKLEGRDFDDLDKSRGTIAIILAEV